MSKQEKLPVWDLSVLYKKTDDPKIQSDVKKNLVDTQKFAKKYKGRVASLDSKQLNAAMKELEAISTLTAKLYYYPMLLASVESDNPKVTVLHQQMLDHATMVQGELLFFDLELMELPAEKLKHHVNNPSLINYKHYLHAIEESKPHHLSEREEQVFNDKSVTSAGAMVKLFDQHFATKKFDNGSNLEEVIKLMNLPDRAKRKLGAELLTKGLNQDERLVTLVFNTIIRDKAIGDRWHKFSYPEQARHLSNEVDKKMVDTMVEVISQNYGMVEEFYNFKKKVMKLPKLYVYDRYAPIGDSDKRYSYTEAKKIILDAFKRFSPEFGKIAKDFFEKNWIHAPVQKGKQGGAYCAGITPDTNPFILINYQGLNESVQTLAHELGHGINDYLMSRQTYFNYGNPITMAETASVFCEMIIFDYFKERITDPKEKFAMYVQKIQSMFATVYRQTSMHKFEQDLHMLQKEKGELTTQEINEAWMRRQKEMFGNSVDLSGSENWWGYIQHFIHTPFYVYGYSFGELLVLSLYAQYKKDPVSFVPKYIEMMSTGSSKSPKEILEPFGINLSDRKFWQGGINIIKELVAEAKQVYEQSKKRS